jgi:RNA polymerase sigma-70 factor (ECF subfamily)
LTLAQNVLNDDARGAARLKRSAPTRAGPEALTNHPGPAAPPEEEASRAELRQRALAVLRSLPEDYRLPLTLRYIAGADYETIEMQLGLSNGSLRGLLYRGLKILRERLSPELGMNPEETG